jgi:hypothetical protein
MRRKILGGITIAIAGVLLLASVVGVVGAWIYNEPVTQRAAGQLGEVDRELASAQSALDIAETETQRALRILNSAETALKSLSQSTTEAQDALKGVGENLDDRIIPGLRDTGNKLDQVEAALQDALDTIQLVNSTGLLPVPLPGEEWLSSVLQSTESLNGQVASLEELATKASTFVSDVAYVSGGDFGETRRGLEQLLDAVTEYQGKIAGWRAQIATIQVELPALIDRACIILTVFFLWFGLSQASLILHGLGLYKGADPFEAIRRGVGT